MREWLVAAGIIEGPLGILLVHNVRRNGMTDWSTPGGVIEEGEEVTEGLSREVVEETGITVSAWEGPVYSVETLAHDLGWHLRVQVFKASAWTGDLFVDDPDGIVTEARFVALDDCASHLVGNAQWVHEPMCEWLTTRWDGHRHFRYHLAGSDRRSMVVTRQ